MANPPQPDNRMRMRLEMGLMILCGIFLIAGKVAEGFGETFEAALGDMEAGTAKLTIKGLYLISYLTGGYFGVLSGMASLRKGVVDVDLLMVLAALGAAYVGAPFEGAMLLFLFALSNVLQNHAMDRSRKAIQALMKLRPDTVQVQAGGEWIQRAAKLVEPGEHVRLFPGESIALDGMVTSGESTIDESSITGESLPIEKVAGDLLYAGTLNQSGSLVYRVTKPLSESTLSRIIHLVEEAQAEKAQTQRFLEKAEQHYALGVILLTLALILVPWKGFGAEFAPTFYRAMTLMVVASPCALIISTPAAFLSAIGGAARRGVLFKGGIHLEQLATVTTVAFDKTGTLTCGTPTVTDIIPVDGIQADEVLRHVAALEALSEHPLAKAIQEAARQKSLPIKEVHSFQALPGQGVTGTVGDQTYLAGSVRCFTAKGISLARHTHEIEQLQENGRSIILLGVCAEDGDHVQVLGIIGIADTVRPEAANVIRQLRELGIRRIVMLTGDHNTVAQKIAQTAGITEVYAERMPEDKVRIIRELSQTERVAMVGDGVNDAPALAAAHTGIAMGAMGADVAMETADVVLMGAQLGQLSHAFALGRKTRRIVAQNLTFALAVILILATLTLTVGIPLPLGVIGHEGSTVLVCLNGLRLLRFRQPHLS